MLFGLIASTIKLFFFPQYVDIFVFPLIFAFSLLGCIIGTYATPFPNPESVAAFYKQTRPWGFWKPVREKVMALDPTFIPNRHFKRDGFNVIVGVVWQMAQLLIPVYFMIRENGLMVLWSGVFLLCSWLLKKYWWNTLED